MSLGYAEKLSYRDDLGGQLGAPELFDTAEELERKVERLAQLVREASRIVAFTGAGISTSCGIPDFRGPAGIWTLQRAGQPLPRPKVSFTAAKPSLTHQALKALMDSGKLTYLVSQNVDGLHLRSGVPRHQLAELHGNCFAERCPKCRTEFVRDFEVETVGFKKTGRSCAMPGCNAKLRDFVLDWEDALPEDELEASGAHARQADLAICLGTSLQITPACDIPLKTIRAYKNKATAGKLVIINLQATKHDKKAVASGGLVIHARSDQVMQLLLSKVAMPVPEYVRHDVALVGHKWHSPVSAVAPSSSSGDPEDATAGGSSAGLAFSVSVQSPHGHLAAMPMVKSVEFRFKDPGLKPAVVDKVPFTVRRTAKAAGDQRVDVIITLHDTADEDKRRVTTSYSFGISGGGGGAQRLEFVTQCQAFDGGPSTAAPDHQTDAAVRDGKRQKLE